LFTDALAKGNSAAAGLITEEQKTLLGAAVLLTGDASAGEIFDAAQSLADSGLMPLRPDGLPAIAAADMRALFEAYLSENGLAETGSVAGFLNYAAEKAAGSDFLPAEEDKAARDFLASAGRISALVNSPNAFSYPALRVFIGLTGLPPESLEEFSELLAGVYALYTYESYDTLLGAGYAVPAENLVNFLLPLTAPVPEGTAPSPAQKLIAGLAEDRLPAARNFLLTADALIREGNAQFDGANYSRLLLTVDLDTDSEDAFAFIGGLRAKLSELYGENAYAAGDIVSMYDLRAAFDTDILLINTLTVAAIFVIVAVTFKSWLIPLLLVTAILGSTWVSLSFSLLTGAKLFFVSYIVALCIQMGATIDYAILLTNNYVSARKARGRAASVRAAVEASLPSILTSGAILVTAGFCIGFIASQNAISSIGILIGRGTVVSVATVLLVLPSVLYLFDKQIEKSIYKAKFCKDADGITDSGGAGGNTGGGGTDAAAGGITDGENTGAGAAKESRGEERI
jgi:hypothetical protein